MASAVVLKHETSTLRQSHNFITIDFKFGVGDNVREITNPAKFGWGPMSSRDATWGQHIFAHNSSKDAVWCNEDPFRDETL